MTTRHRVLLGLTLVACAFLDANCSSKSSDGARESAQTSIAEYQDVRTLDLRGVAGLDTQLISTLWFSSGNRWSESSQRIADEILEKGKDPGLGIRALHEQGITGKGVTVAIIDQNICLDHPEFSGNIVKYYDVGTKEPSNRSSMHGAAVASLLVGRSIGTAPGAPVYFVAAPSWTADAQYQAAALNWIIDENETLPVGQKIRVVSVSAAPSGPGSPFTKNNASWDAAYDRATKSGILVLDCTSNHGLTAACYYDLDARDDVTKCVLGWPGQNSAPDSQRLYVPTSRRTQAEEYHQGQCGYQYTGRGGLSWSIPYLTGVLAMAWQLRPDLSATQLIDMLFETAYVPDGKSHIINPPAFIKKIQSLPGREDAPNQTLHPRAARLRSCHRHRKFSPPIRNGHLVLAAVGEVSRSA